MREAYRKQADVAWGRLKPEQTPIVVIVSIGAVDLLWSGYLAYWFINYHRRNVPSRTRAAVTTFITSIIFFLPQVLIWTFVFIASWPIAFYFFNSDRFGRSRNDFFYWRRVLGFPWEVLRSTNSCRMDYWKRPDDPSESVELNNLEDARSAAGIAQPQPDSSPSQAGPSSSSQAGPSSSAQRGPPSPLRPGEENIPDGLSSSWENIIPGASETFPEVYVGEPLMSGAIQPVALPTQPSEPEASSSQPLSSDLPRVRLPWSGRPQSTQTTPVDDGGWI